MDITKKSVFKALEQLEEEEFNQFKWHLWNGVIKDISPISRGKLEKIKCHGVVDLMVQKYSADAGKIAVQVLRNMEQNELAHRLELNFQKVQQSVQEEARNAPESMQPIQSDWLRAYNITACSQQFKQRLLREKGNDVYMPTSRSQRKGSALLITNIKFDSKEDCRDGAEKDEENMEWLLSALGYSVEKHTNLSGNEIDGKVKNFSKRYEHRDADSTFVVIMSHGERIQNKDAILGVHYDPDLHPDDYFFVEDIFTHLNSVNCPALIDKPKVILIQACRGGDDGGVYVPDRVPASDAWVHKEKDFVCFMSSLPDTVSYRDPDNGSYLIMYIVDVFSTCAHNDDIMELFRKVASRMENDPRFTEEEKLLPCIERMSLVRKFYLFPGL
ncbi:caspase-1-A-like [Sinocyclocheilus grahami]|uniref:Caspase-1-A-like n=1 Tax=Sinocyclocheilus grahami TaxID=75366 RepID=A0A672M931_SINGR|nr:PREDICTED: caspase-1-A-like [Sinocyclocheilus grahami]